MRHEIHDITTIFSWPSPERLAELTTDIRQNGIRVPVMLWRDPGQGGRLLIVDGRVRAVIAAELEIAYPTNTLECGWKDMCTFVLEANKLSRVVSPNERLRMQFAMQAGRQAAKRNESMQIGSTPVASLVGLLAA